MRLPQHAARQAQKEGGRTGGQWPRAGCAAGAGKNQLSEAHGRHDQELTSGELSIEHDNYNK